MTASQTFRHWVERHLPRNSLHWSAVVLGTLLSSAWQPGHADTLNLQINNIPNNQGSLMVEVLPNEAAFKDEAPAIAQIILPAQTGSVSISTDALPAGTYGVRIMHDVDGDGELKTNMVGIPREPWGFSNNATGSFGPPKWKDVSFELTGEANQTIDLVH